MSEKILIIGAGHQGMAMAAHLAISGEQINIWNRSERTIALIRETKTIECIGCVSGEAHIHEISTNIEDVLESVIMITTPSVAHKDIARVLAPVLRPQSIVVLNPGRTFGAYEFLTELEKAGCKNIPYVAETQSIIYTCRKMKENEACIYALKSGVKLACANGDVEIIKRKMPESIRDRFSYINSVMETSLSNIGMILHCAPVLLNAGWIESPIHKFEYYYDGITPAIAKVLEKMDAERIRVAEALGVKVESLVEWFKSAYHVEGDSIFECIQRNAAYRGIDAPLSLEHRYLDEDVPNGLVPIEALGRELGIDVTTITQMIDLAILVRGVDYRSNGRQIERSMLNI